MTAPNPGSDAAIERGCTCPIFDNEHGRGVSWPFCAPSEVSFWIENDCPLHGRDSNWPAEEE